MIDVGRLCVKIAGRDAGRKCIVVSILDNNFVLIDGETRRRKCNIIHLEPLAQVLDVKDNAAHDAVVSAFKKLGIELKASKKKAKTVRPRTLRRSKLAEKSVDKNVKNVDTPKPKAYSQKKLEASAVNSEKGSVEEKKSRAEKKVKVAENKKN